MDVEDDADDAFDVVTVGAGIAGLSVASALVARGAGTTTVLVVDAGDVGSGATGMSAGTYSAPGPELGVAALDGSEAALVDDALTVSSRRVLRELDAAGYDVGLREVGALELALSDSQREHVEREHRELRARGYAHARLVDRDEAAALEPALARGGSALRCALFKPWSGYVDAAKVAAALADRVASRGGSVWERDPVTRVTWWRRPSRPRRVWAGCRAPSAAWAFDALDFGPDRSPWEPAFVVWLRSGRRVAAEQVVLAAGAATPRLARDALPVPLAMAGVPTQAQAVLMHAPNPQLSRVVYASELYAAGLRHTHRAGEAATAAATPSPRRVAFHTYGRPWNADAGDASAPPTFFGFDRVPTAEGDVQPNAARVDESLRYVSTFLGELSDSAVQRGSWTCVMPFSGAADGEPVAGSLRAFGLPGVFVVAGLGPRGIERGPGLGEFVAAQMRRQPRAEAEDRVARAVARALDPARTGSGVRPQ